MWDEIFPSTEWVKSNVPQVRRRDSSHYRVLLPFGFSVEEVDRVVSGHHFVSALPVKVHKLIRHLATLLLQKEELGLLTAAVVEGHGEVF